MGRSKSKSKIWNASKNEDWGTFSTGGTPSWQSSILEKWPTEAWNKPSILSIYGHSIGFRLF